MPIHRFKDYLVKSGSYAKYLRKLHAAYNTATAENVMCRSLLSVGWDGQLYDCDFNQMLKLPVGYGAPAHILNFDYEKLRIHQIVVGKQCYGCSAGAGSSCSGAVA